MTTPDKEGYNPLRYCFSESKLQVVLKKMEQHKFLISDYKEHMAWTEEQWQEITDDLNELANEGCQNQLSEFYVQQWELLKEDIRRKYHNMKDFSNKTLKKKFGKVGMKLIEIMTLDGDLKSLPQEAEKDSEATPSTSDPVSVTPEKPSEAESTENNVSKPDPVETLPLIDVSKPDPVETLPLVDVSKPDPIKTLPLVDVSKPDPVEPLPLVDVSKPDPVETLPLKDVSKPDPVEALQSKSTNPVESTTPDNDWDSSQPRKRFKTENNFEGSFQNQLIECISIRTEFARVRKNVEELLQLTIKSRAPENC